MLRYQDMTPEQINKIAKFINTYDDSTIKLYSEIFSKQRREVLTKPYYKAYLSIVYRTAQLIKEMGISDPMSASIIFEYLLWNGYLSKDKHLVYCMSGRINNMAITGADIMRGKSVCLNNADMLTRVLNGVGLEAYTLGCGVFPTKDTKKEFVPAIERDRIPERKNPLVKLIGYPIVKKIGNHAVTLIKVGDYYCISDPTSLAFANITDVLKARYVGVDLDMDLKPWLTLAIDKGDKDEFVESLVKAFLLSDQQILDVDTVRSFYENIIELCDENRALLDDFHDANHHDIETVCKTLTKTKLF